MAKRRGNGEGTITKRHDGRWVAAVTVEGGRRKWLYGRTRLEVANKLAVALKARLDGLPIPGERLTVAQYLVSWLEGYRNKVRPSTWRRCEEYVRIHARPVIGGVRLARLTAQHLEDLYADRLRAGCSPTSVHHLHAVLHRALKQAVRMDIVSRNVAENATPPSMQRYEMTTLSEDQARRLLEAARGERFEALYVLGLTTGMRRGELLALRWHDVNLAKGKLQVTGSLQMTPSGFRILDTKTKGSRRGIDLTEAAMSALRSHKARQAEERLALGSEWEDMDLVFANRVGRPIEPRNMMRRSFVPLLERAGLPRITFHALRHTSATLMMGMNLHPKVVSEMLGHSRIGTTLDLYSHVTPTMQREAIQAIDEMLGA